MLSELIGAAAIAVLSVTTSEVLSTNVFGGPGGADFRYVCERNGYLVGLKVRGGNWVDSVQAVCAKFDPRDGKFHGAAPEGPVFGGAGGGLMEHMSWYVDECRSGEYIYSFDVGEPEKFSYVGQIRLSCFSSKAGGPPPNNPHRIIIKGADALKKGTRFENCPPGRAAMGIRGRAGSYVDAFGLICGPVGNPATPQTQVIQNGPGDTTFRFPTLRSKTGVTHLIDVCLYFGKSCGKPAAEQFCRDNKFNYLVSFEGRPNAGFTVVRHGDPDICKGEGCVGFNEIRCSQSKPVASPADTSSVDFGGVAGKPLPLPPIVPQPPSPGGAGGESGSKVGNGWNGYTHYFAADFTGDGKADLLARAANGDVFLYPFDGKSFYGGGGPIAAGNGWNFTHYATADWNGDGKTDILARAANGDAFLYTMANNGFYGGGPQKVAQDWQYTHYFAADFTGDGSTDLVGRSSNGELMMLPTYALAVASEVGDGWNFTHYFVGDFSGDAKSDLLVRNEAGDLLLYPYGTNGFVDGGGPIKAGNGWNFTHYWSGDWTGDGVSDLLVRSSSGELSLVPMANNTFYNGGGARSVGTGWDFTHYFSADFSGDGAPDMVVRTKTGDLLYYPWKGTSF